LAVAIVYCSAANETRQTDGKKPRSCCSCYASWHRQACPGDFIDAESLPLTRSSFGCRIGSDQFL